MIRVRVCRCVRVCVFVCWNPTVTFFFSLLCLLLLLPYHTVRITPSLKLQKLPTVADTVQQSHIKFVWITTMRVDIAYACMFCVCHIRVRVCRCVRVCLLACWNATFQFFVFFCSACCCCCRIMSASHRPSSSQALYFVAATVQQQSHSKFVWITTTVCACGHCICVSVLCVL